MTMPSSCEQQHPSVSPLIATVAGWCRKWKSGSSFSGLGNCTPGDIDRIASDLGVTPADLRSLERADEPLLLPQLLAELHIDAAELARSEPAVLRDLQRVCSLCDCKQRCKMELAEGDAAATYESFCPNALTLKALM
jgi:hypothetical protein